VGNDPRAKWARIVFVNIALIGTGATADVQLDPVLLPDLDHRLQRQLVLLPVAGVARVRAVAHDHQPARLHIL